MRLIEDADLEVLQSEVRKTLYDIVKHSKSCQLKQGRPRRFLFSVKDPIISDINHYLQIDVVSLCERNLLRVINIRTGFQNAGFVDKMDSIRAWKLFRQHWIDVYAGAPDFITTDAETKLNSQTFEDSAEGMGSIVRIVPSEAHDRVGLVERNHVYLRTVYEELCINMPSLRKEERLSLTFRAINDCPNAESEISLTAFVFDTYPKIPGRGCRANAMEMADVIRECTRIVCKMNARRAI